ncbi:unnamed protein product [Mytilus coruscus]|uniref:MULE transposase domain-containing protein n=1 Tax=Mytilus coruscus TaxID=42192 RepID=A0A6J8ECK1_MYTCO|nr:unnamed protein product [Mytilus coruscus]
MEHGIPRSYYRVDIRDGRIENVVPADGESLQYVLASEKQLMDLDTFCTHQLHFSVFSVDSTFFNIGNYYVTNTCFENLRVVHASGKYKGRHPLEMGPTFVHTHRDENCILDFFSALDRMIPNFRYQMQAIGSDGDEATMNAIASEKFKSHLIKAVTDQAQLDGHFSNNRVESTNNNVKDWVGRSGKVTLPVFNRKVEEYVTCQQQEFEMAIYANGPYDLASHILI